MKLMLTDMLAETWCSAATGLVVDCGAQIWSGHLAVCCCLYTCAFEIRPSRVSSHCWVAFDHFACSCGVPIGCSVKSPCWTRLSTSLFDSADPNVSRWCTKAVRLMRISHLVSIVVTSGNELYAAKSPALARDVVCGQRLIKHN